MKKTTVVGLLLLVIRAPGVDVYKMVRGFVTRTELTE